MCQWFLEKGAHWGCLCMYLWYLETSQGPCNVTSLQPTSDGHRALIVVHTIGSAYSWEWLQNPFVLSCLLVAHWCTPLLTSLTSSVSMCKVSHNCLLLLCSTPCARGRRRKQHCILFPLPWKASISSSESFTPRYVSCHLKRVLPLETVSWQYVQLKSVQCCLFWVKAWLNLELFGYLFRIYCTSVRLCMLWCLLCTVVFFADHSACVQWDKPETSSRWPPSSPSGWDVWH